MKIAAVADLHVRTHAHTHTEIFKKASAEADVLVLCGDLTDLGLPEEARILGEDIARMKIPVLGIPGNHDFHSGKYKALQEILRAAGLLFIDEEPRVIEGVGFVGVKGFGGGFGSHMIDSFGEDAWKQLTAESLREALRLERLLHAVEAQKVVVALHYSPIVETIAGEAPEIFPYLGSSRLCDVVDRFMPAVVFHGHAHRGAHEGKTRGGVPVYNVAHALMHSRGSEYLLFEI